MSARLISLIGAPAAGKTTLAQRLSEELAAGLILEDYAGNPFLAESYAGKAQAKLPGQLYFLMSRVGQLSRLSWPAEGLVVSDYAFCQDRIFARLGLEGSDLRTYEKLARRVDGLVHEPDMVVFLAADASTLLRRIAHRGRGFEQALTGGFLETIQRAYEEAVAELTCPVIRVDCGRTDLRQGDERAALIEEIRRRLAERADDGE